MNKQEKMLDALQRMQEASDECSDLEVAYLGYALVQTAAVVHHIPVENLLLNCMANVNVVDHGNGDVEVHMSVGDDD